MTLRQVGAVLMVLLTACGSTPRVSRSSADGGEGSPAAARYGLLVLSPRSTPVSPVEVDEDDFMEAVTRLAREARPVEMPREEARQLLAQALSQVEGEHVIRLAPVNVSVGASRVEAELTREYLRWCQRMQGGGDCLRLLVDGPTVRGDDRYALALAISLGSVLGETTKALKGMVQPSAVLSLLVWAAVVYLLLWALPDPLSKTIAAGMTVLLLGWLGVDTVWSLMRGWVRLVEDADRATTFDELSKVGETFGRVMGENTARVLVMVATAALGGAVPKLAKLMPKLPGFSQAAVQAEAQGGLRLAAIAEVESVAVSSEGTFSVLMKSPGSRAGAATAESEAAVTTIIRHQGGNRQVLTNGQRWHVPANKPLKELPAADPVGDRLQAAAARSAERWSARGPDADELIAIQRAAAQGKTWLARLLERQSRGRFVESELRRQFPELRWSRTGVDAVDPATGYRYEVLSGTVSNLALHGQRMADALFRMITF